MRKFVATATLTIVGALSFYGVASADVIIVQPNGDFNRQYSNVQPWAGAPPTGSSAQCNSLTGPSNVFTDFCLNAVADMDTFTGDVHYYNCSWGSPNCSYLSYTNYFYIHLTNGVIDYIQGQPVYQTSVIVTSPVNASTTATTTVTGATVYINEDDYVDGMYLRMNFVNNTVANGAGFAFEAWDAAFGGIDLPITSAGFSTVSTSTTFYTNGKVTATWQIRQPNDTWLIGSILSDSVVLSTTTYFVVSQMTALDYIMSSTSAVLVNALLTGTTTAQSVIRCNPTDFDILICATSLVVPPYSVLVDDFEQLRDGFLARWPLGYVTRFVEIFADTSSSSIPVISATVPSGVVGAGASITLNANNALDFILNATTSSFLNSSASSTETFYEITSRYWNIFVYLALGFWILRRILGSHIIGHSKHKNT